MSKFLIGLLIGIILVPLGFYLYLRSGDAPVATSAPPMPLERFFVRTAMHSTIASHETPVHLVSVSNDSLVAGAHVYMEDCAVCHGTPGEPPTAVARGMYPRPPQFFRPNAKKIDDPPDEVYWKVENGIRLTGMPGFHQSLKDGQVRDLTAFIERATDLPPAAVAVLKPAPSNVLAPTSPPRSHGRVRHKRT